MSAQDDKPEPFPSLSPVQSSAQPEITSPKTPVVKDGNRPRSGSSAADRARRTRGTSLLNTFVNSNPPLGMWQATGEVGSKIPTLPEIKNGAFTEDGWSHEGQCETRKQDPQDIHKRRLTRTGTSPKLARSPTSPTVPKPLPAQAVTEDKEEVAEGVAQETEKQLSNKISSQPFTMVDTQVDDSGSSTSPVTTGPDATGTYPNGYRFPKKHTWGQATVIGMKAFWKFFITPFGFVITIYGLNVVAWGAMIFFVLLNAAPAMCHPSCNVENSPRKIWIEIDSQVLNGLFCVPAFGLIPWRFRDFYYLMRWRVKGDELSHRRLAGTYRGWYRLPGSDQLPINLAPPPVVKNKKTVEAESPPPYSDHELSVLEANNAIPLPVSSMPEAPLTGFRAQTTKSWNLDIVIWMYILNTAFQACLAGCMWGFNRHNRPSWTTALFIVTGCLTGIFAGIVVFIEGSKVKKIEGIPVQEYDVLESIEDYQKRKTKEDAKDAKKHSREKSVADAKQSEVRIVERTEKVKGKQWFTRH